MTASDAAFAGSIPALYEQYLGSLLFQPFAEDMAGRLRDVTSGRVLETAAGTGIVTRALVKVLPPQVEIIATDLNQAMLDLAQTKLQAPNVTWRQTNAQTLPFEDSSFDAVVCQFGVMFFPDKQAAFREALRVLKPGGRFHMVDFAGPNSGRRGWLARRIHANHHLKDNEQDRVLAFLRDAGLADPYVVGRRDSPLGSVNYYQATAPAPGV